LGCGGVIVVGSPRGEGIRKKEGFSRKNSDRGSSALTFGGERKKRHGKEKE